jgi:hypothetical protein
MVAIVITMKEEEEKKRIQSGMLTSIDDLYPNSFVLIKCSFVYMMNGVNMAHIPFLFATFIGFVR